MNDTGKKGTTEMNRTEEQNSNGGLTLLIPADIANAGEAAAHLRTAAIPFFDAARPLCDVAQTIAVTSVDDKAGMKLARDTRLKIRAVRIDAERTRKALKEDALRVGQAIDKVFNGLRDALAQYEGRLEEHENYATRVEAERKAAVKRERDDVLRGLGVDPTFYNSGEMTVEVFEACVGGIKARKEEDERRAQQAEQERVDRERKEAEERAERERRESEERRAQQAENERLRAQADAERAAREKAEAELREKNRIEAEKAEADRRAKEEAEQAPDRQKMIDFANRIIVMDRPQIENAAMRRAMQKASDEIDAVARRIIEFCGNGRKR